MIMFQSEVLHGNSAEKHITSTVSYPAEAYLGMRTQAFTDEPPPWGSFTSNQLSNDIMRQSDFISNKLITP